MQNVQWKVLINSKKAYISKKGKDVEEEKKPSTYFDCGCLKSGSKTFSSEDRNSFILYSTTFLQWAHGNFDKYCDLSSKKEWEGWWYIKTAWDTFVYLK